MARYNKEPPSSLKRVNNYEMPNGKIADVVFIPKDKEGEKAVSAAVDDAPEKPKVSKGKLGDNPLYHKYFKLLTMHMPIFGVKAKMEREHPECDSDLLDDGPDQPDYTDC